MAFQAGSTLFFFEKKEVVSDHNVVGEFELHIILVAIPLGLNVAGCCQVLLEDTQESPGVHDPVLSIPVHLVVLHQRDILTVLFAVDAVTIHGEEKLPVQGCLIIPAKWYHVEKV